MAGTQHTEDAQRVRIDRAVDGPWDSVVRVFRENIRNSVMFIALIIVIAFFAIWSGGTFIDSFNLTNLVAQTAVVGIMACGMTLVIIIRHIDLSVGYMCGFLGAITGILLQRHNMSSGLSILLVMALGACIGFIIGFLVGKVGMPAFVVTLGAMIAAHGLELNTTSASGAITITNQFFNALGTGYIPAVFTVGSFKGSTLVIGIAGIALFIFFQFTGRARQHRNSFTVDPVWWFAIKMVVVCGIAAFLTYQFASLNGISWALVILAGVVFIIATLQNHTRFGRHVYGIGGNPEAAELSGVNVARVTIIVFVIMGVLTALGGILLTSWMKATDTAAGTGFELLVIAGCFIGGCSPAGGIGRVTGSLIGALIMQSLVNGLSLQGVNISYQYMIQGAILVLAVLFDILSRRVSAAKL